MANFKAQVWTGFLWPIGPSIQQGDWKTAESWNFFCQNHLKFYFNGGHFYEKFYLILIPNRNS